MPKRKCVGCGQLKPREELLKITKEHSSGKVVIEPSSKIFGRSAYFCYNKNCKELALKKKQIESGSQNLRGFERVIGWTRILE